MSKNKSEKKSETVVSAIVTRLIALAAIFEKVTVSPLVESVILGLLGMVEDLASDAKVAPFVGPAMPTDPTDAKAMAEWAVAYVAAKAEFDSKAGDERKRVKGSLNDGFASIIEENALSGKGIDPAVRARAEQMLREGKPASAIATETGVSQPTLANWKKAMGLVKERTK